MEPTFSENELLVKARSYCARQERCQQEVRDKLYGWGGHIAVVENIVSQLIGERFLNEMRFAEHFAVSKFRQKGWGKRKVEAALRLKSISAQCIAKALASIDSDEYDSELLKAVDKRLNKLHDINPYIARRKVINYFMGKGYASGQIEKALEKLNE
ncbi:MAG: RecX family transcriptional regulator [Flavobacteriales bacterium]|nr:RecX family transcriptional regulator [Flavobacteriales bacterium]